jgi:SOS-response transcriptional repressor LexA
MKEFQTSYSIHNTAQQLNLNTWDAVHEILKRLRTAKSGWLTLTSVPQQPIGPLELQVIMERQHYYLMLGELIEANGSIEHNVRTYSSPEVQSKTRVEIHGYEWPTQMVCRDPNVIEEIFLEFFQTGDVSSQKLS